MSGLELRGSICPKVSCILKSGAHNGKSGLLAKILFIVILNTNHRGSIHNLTSSRLCQNSKDQKVESS